MKRLPLATAFLSLALMAVPAFAGGDDFKRENKNRAFKDALEGKAPPALQVDQWINAGPEGVSWESLRGKVVVIDFWGTW